MDHSEPMRELSDLVYSRGSKETIIQSSPSSVRDLLKLYDLLL